MFVNGQVLSVEFIRRSFSEGGLGYKNKEELWCDE
jgi:hypothetical protein